mgnify:FL=1
MKNASAAQALKEKAGDAASKWLAKNRSLVLRQTPRWAQGLAGVLIGLSSIAIIGGIFFRIDEVVTVNGQLKSIGGSVDVKTPAGGRVFKVFYDDGQVIKKGDKLIQFDTTRAAEQKITVLKLMNAEEDELKNQLLSIRSQEVTLDGRLKVLEKRVNTKEKLLSAMEGLVEVGGFQRMQFLEQKDQLLSLQQNLNELNEQKNRLSLEESQIKLRSRKSLDQMRNSLKQAELELQYQNVLAPVSGVVFDPQATEQGVLQPGERILTIVPQEGLFAEVYVPNKDIGYLKLGQEAKVRVDAFPFTRYGELDGSVSQIAADALPPSQKINFYSYPLKIKLQHSYLETQDIKIPLKPGMAITTNLKLRDKRLISLLSDVFVDQTDSIRSLRQQ